MGLFTPRTKDAVTAEGLLVAAGKLAASVAVPLRHAPDPHQTLPKAARAHAKAAVLAVPAPATPAAKHPPAGADPARTPQSAIAKTAAATPIPAAAPHAPTGPPCRHRPTADGGGGHAGVPWVPVAQEPDAADAGPAGGSPRKRPSLLLSGAVGVALRDDELPVGIDGEGRPVLPLPPPPASVLAAAPPVPAAVDPHDPLVVAIYYHEHVADLRLATYYFSVAAAMRHPVGLFLYAMSLRHGWGVRRNERAAVVLLQRAAERAVRDLMARSPPAAAGRRAPTSRGSAASSTARGASDPAAPAAAGAQETVAPSERDSASADAATHAAHVMLGVPGARDTLLRMGHVGSTTTTTTAAAATASPSPSSRRLLTAPETTASRGAAADPAAPASRTGSIGASGTAASHELGLAIYELAMSFRQGWGVAKDKASAMYYLQIAAQLGDVDAQMALGEAYLAGKGVRRDKRLAAKWFRSAERQGARMVSQQWIWKEKYDLV